MRMMIGKADSKSTDHAATTASARISHVDVICLRSGGGSCMCDDTNAWVHHHCDDFKAFAEVVAEPWEDHKIKTRF
jgi:hypothetical protein